MLTFQKLGVFYNAPKTYWNSHVLLLSLLFSGISSSVSGAYSPDEAINDSESLFETFMRKPVHGHDLGNSTRQEEKSWQRSVIPGTRGRGWWWQAVREKWHWNRTRFGVEKQQVLREERAGQRGGERVRKRHVWSPMAACLKPWTLIRDNWEGGRRNVGTHLGEALDIFGLFPQREGVGEGRKRKILIKSKFTQESTFLKNY